MVYVGSAPAVDPRRAAADEAVTALYAAHWRALVRLAWLLLHDEPLAEDIVQDAFVAVHRRWDSLRDPAKATAYLRRSVVNGARSALRHRGVEQRHLATVGPSLTLGDLDRRDGPQDEAVARERHHEMLAALAGLPERQREVLVLRYYLDLSEAQIAHALGISAGSVKSHASRGLAALRTRQEETA